MQSTAPVPALTLTAPTEHATDAIGAALADVLAPGDTVTLSGPLGVGKSHLARAVIRAILGDPEAEIPSPSYTLVNVYTAGGAEIWHADLYRLSDPEEIVEIGLEDAVADNIVLVEWPERWAPQPERRLEIALGVHQGSETRELRISAHGEGWDRVLQKLRVEPDR